jgi:hypothetical protein
MLSIKAIPAAIDFLKATEFVQTMTLAINFVARNEFHCTGNVSSPACPGGTYTESQPTLLIVQLDSARARFGMPCCCHMGRQFD